MDGMETLATVVERDRERLNAEREAIFNQQRELDEKLGEINRELSAIDAYENAKLGRKTTVATRSNGSRRGRGRPAASSSRRGSKREALLDVVRGANGLTRGEILERMNLKGNKSGEMSVSNALTALVKANQITRDGRKYRVSA